MGIADKTRGAVSNVRHRFQKRESEFDPGDWALPDWIEDDAPGRNTKVDVSSARSAISLNQSPDVPFSQSVNPYQGCEHGCIYCFARPSHAYHDLNPGLDFESRIIAKPNITEVLRKELGSPRYRVQPLAIAPNTDAWQPIEARLGLTRSLLELMVETKHPCVAITKSRLVLRDIGLLRELAQDNLLRIMVSVTSLNPAIKRSLEPRAAGPQSRLRIIETLAEAGIPVGCLLAPVIPAINDEEIESILSAVRDAGASRAGWIFLRLPHEVAPLFEAWLQTHYPQRAEHVMSLIRQSRGGRAYSAEFSQRQRGTGAYAALLDQRFRLACRKLGLNDGSYSPDDLATHLFRAPVAPSGPQASLF